MNIPLRLVVVCGLLVKDNKLLVGLKKEREFWEFPGGKVEKEESLEHGLEREMREELGVDIKNQILLAATLGQSFKDRNLILIFYAITSWDNNPQALHHKTIEWRGLEELETINLLPANQNIFPEIKRQLKSKKLLE